MAYNNKNRATITRLKSYYVDPVLYLLYIRIFIPICEVAVIATFAYDTAFIAEGNIIEETIEKLQSAIDGVNSWTDRWLIKLNE